MATNFEKFQKLLEELFQLDQADLDFGIYRIMNQKRDEVVRFLEIDLLPQVKDAFGHYQSADKAIVERELEKLTQQILAAGMNPEDSPKVRELKSQLISSSIDVTALENEVFSHLFNFFRRYYHEGDFISLRRYKEGVYAIPYEGEEVKLHWANQDQYYVKSSEYLRDYIFAMPSGKRVRVHLVSATTEQDNKKEVPGKQRRFVLCEKDPIYEDSGELFIRFEYRPEDEKKKQDTLNQDAIKSIFEAKGFEEWVRELSKLAPTKSNPSRTVLEKHLTQYTAKNTFDYFIHKDLGGFLRRELDFYIKNEVMHLDDIEHDTVPRVEQYLSKIKVIRKISHKIIHFLEQLENFQKKLWLKKKFVVETNYCITLDRVPENLYPEIAANDSQQEEWVQLFAISDIKKDLLQPGFSQPLSVDFLKANKFLVLDTRHFDASFKQRLLSSIEDITSQMTGLCVNGENMQALRLLGNTFRSSIQCIYIDPPYNTGEDDNFPYKDQYQRSSWLSMLKDRMALGRSVLSEDGVFLCSIGIEEHGHIESLFHLLFGEQNKIAELVWEKGRKNDARRFSVGHDYIYLYALSIEALEHLMLPWREPKEGVLEIIMEYHKLKKLHRGNLEKMSEGLAAFYKNLPADHPSKKYQRSKNVDSRGIWRDNNISWPGGGGPRYELLHPITGQPCVVPKDGWRFIESTMNQKIADGFVVFREDHTKSPFLKSYIYVDGGADDEESNSGLPQVMGSVFYRHSQPSNDWMKALFGEKLFANPKDHEILGRLFRYVSHRDSIVLDYFAGSGSTGHAVIESNRLFGGERKYILIEVGAHFDAVLLPRLKKATYSNKWEETKPVDRDGVSQFIKYVRLESYEDALNNLELKQSAQQKLVLDQHKDLREQYILSYMLDVESRGSHSLLNVESFSKPDQYKLKVERNGQTQLVSVDLIETFNFLLGLKVKHFDTIKSVRVVEGINPDGDRVLVLWRDIEETSSDALDDWFKKQRYNTQDQEFDVIYVNGDNNLENLRRANQTWKVRLIEEEFARLMFDVQDI